MPTNTEHCARQPDATQASSQTLVSGPRVAKWYRWVPIIAGALALSAGLAAAEIGREVAIPRHLQDGEEFQLSIPELVAFGQKLFAANWTSQEGAGRPLTKGTGSPLSDPTRPLVFPRNFNRISAPDANSCAGCHDNPVVGGNGDLVGNVFVLAQRFDFATFNLLDALPTCETVDERGQHTTQQTIGNFRATPGMFGAGYIEMLARQMTADLQAIRNRLKPGQTAPLVSKGVSFGTLTRRANGTWDTSKVQGLAAPSLVSVSATAPPSLILRPFHQAGHVISLRQFSNNAYNHHHGIQPTERFGTDTDQDGDGLANEMTRADVTAVSVFQATMPVPGRVIPRDPAIEAAVLKGEAKFAEIGCVRCHVPALPLDNFGWIYTEPNPFNPAGNLRPGDAPTFSVDLSDPELPTPRLPVSAGGVVWVPAFTDLKLHDITSGPDDPNREPIDMNQPAGTAGFFAGNGKFLTRKLWGAYGKPNFYHHGLYTTMREAILAHAGEAESERLAFEALSPYERDCVVEFLKTLQVLPPGTTSLAVDERGEARIWPPLELLHVERQGAQVTLRWTPDSPLSPVPRRCQVQRSEDLAAGRWENRGEPTTATEFTDTSTSASGFYRVVLVED
ncbi:MAG: thiol oxidoreductase [Verrucomicrobia bacterium]|nr:thiol oxidoreductase [Verrucomicrobiota bacterium]